MDKNVLIILCVYLTQADQCQVALPVGFYGSLQWIGWLSLLDEVALNHWNTQKKFIKWV